jgi:hypothetical protein
MWKQSPEQASKNPPKTPARAKLPLPLRALHLYRRINSIVTIVFWGEGLWNT